MEIHREPFPGEICNKTMMELSGGSIINSHYYYTPVPVLTDKKIAYIRGFVHESILKLSDVIYSHPDPISKNTKWVIDLISECRRQATLMSSYAVAMERFMDESGGRSPYFIYESFSYIVEKIFSSINDRLEENAWENDEEVDIEFNEFLFELEEAYFKVKCATTRINLYYS